MAKRLIGTSTKTIILALLVCLVICGTYLWRPGTANYWLQVAARTNVALAVKPLVALGASPSPSRIDDQPLWQAVIRGNQSTVVALLEAGADIHASDDYALGVAAKYGQLDIIRLLLARGANLHAKNDWALRIAASAGQLKTVKILLDFGANVHASNDEAVKWAQEEGHSDIVKLLQMHTDGDRPRNSLNAEPTPG